MSKLLALFPGIDRRDLNREAFLSNCSDWLSSYSTGPPDIMTCWEDDNSLSTERSAYTEQEAEFQQESTAFGVNLLREEADRFSYYRGVRDLLKVRLQDGELVLLLGPTAGGEAEVVVSAGGTPRIVGEPSFWLRLCEERLFEDRVNFGAVAPEEIENGAAHYVVLSDWFPDSELGVSRAYELVGLYGYVLFSATNQTMVSEALKLGLVRRQSRKGTALFFKHPGLPETVSGDDECS